MKLPISVNENLVFSLWDRPEQCPQDEVMVLLELSASQAGKLGLAGIQAKEKVEKIRRLKEVRNEEAKVG
jgi:hypothetical protein